MTSLTLLDLLESRVQKEPLKTAYSFCSETSGRQENLTLQALAMKARAIAGSLQRRARSGERVLIVSNPGLDFITTFFGCLYGGFIAVPVAPPARKAIDYRIQRIAADAGASMVAGALERQMETLSSTLGHQVQLIGTDEIKDSKSEGWRAPDIAPASIAFLQYTSGSTGTPKGVMVSHANLLSNAAHMQHSFGINRHDRSVLWLPLFHDMGLIAGVIQTIFSEYHTLFIAPSAFMNRPLTWLELISQQKATISGGPNFAYEICIEAALRGECPLVDLSSWRVAFNGSEMVRPETLRRFAEVFGRYGFCSAAFRPCYGLAEATLLVSQNDSSELVLDVDKELLSQGRVQSAIDGNGRRQPLACVGHPKCDLHVAIVDPETMESRKENQIGEIWLSGPTITLGYWNRSDETRQSFQAELKNALAGKIVGPYLRTGDLGFVVNNELYITGRLKDLIIIRGRNYYPQDIEATVESSHPALRRGSGAAFSIELAGEERLVIVQEVTRHGLKTDSSQAINIIRESIATEHELTPHSVVLVRPGTIPKTTSGKIQRQACRRLYLEGNLDVIASSNSEISTTLPVFPASPGNGTLRASLQQTLGRLIGCDAESVDVHRPLNALGLDSMMALKLKMAIESYTSLDIPVSRLLGEESIEEIFQWISRSANENSTLAREQYNAASSARLPLSAGQRALWFLAQLDPEKNPLTIARLVRVRGRLDRQALQQAFAALIQRHPSLRMRIGLEDGEPHQEFANDANSGIDEQDLCDSNDELLEKRFRQDAERPFDLDNGPVVRLHLYSRSESETVLLFCAHHLAVDLWSLTLIAQELSLLYVGCRTGRQAALPESNCSYADYVQWQNSMLAGADGERLWKFWSERLSDAAPSLNLQIGRSGTPSGETQSHRFELPETLTRQLKEIAARNQVTLHALLLASFEALLYRHSGQNDFLLGVLSTGRTTSRWKDVVGYFVNPVALRPRIGSGLSFEEHLKRTRNELLEALDHSDYPFPALVEKLHPNRSWRTAPLLQVMCMLQPASSHDNDLASFALGCSGSSFRAADVLFESMESNFDRSQFELVFAAGESLTTTQAVFHFDTGRFEAEAIGMLAADYVTLLEGVTADSRRPIDRLPLRSIEQMKDLVKRQGDETCAEIEEICIHQAIELRAARSPNSVAVVYESLELRYIDLDRQANQLAHFLRQAGVSAESAVGVYLERSPALIIALLGILKASAAYVPLDPAHPLERIQLVLQHSPVRIVLTSESLGGRLSQTTTARIICLDRDAEAIANLSSSPLHNLTLPDNLAYVMFTSGSTGIPKGVMISHRNVINFFKGMDAAIGCGPADTLVAVTSVSFDISVLELLWTLSRGVRVLLVNDPLTSAVAHRKSRISTRRKSPRFSLFYFASTDVVADSTRYRLLLEGAKLADQLGFEAVWTPERHFHQFGGLYPNPSVTSAALAIATSRIQVRAGSVVLPLQNPVRVAEEWALVDNLSNGRTGIAFASGWHANDFVFFPEHYQRRKEVMLQGIETVRRLWQGESLEAVGGSGNTIEIRTYPRPIQPELPVWLTSGGSIETFVSAAEIHANVLTHLLGQDVKDVAQRIQTYRNTLERMKQAPETGTVTLMLHAYVDDTEEKVRSMALVPFKRYLESSAGLVATLVRSLNLDVNLEKMSDNDRNDLITFAAERYLNTSGLFGTERSCLDMVERLMEIGVDEIACLIDFGIPAEAALQSVQRIHDLSEQFLRECTPSADYSLAGQLTRYPATMMQCTPSLLRILMQNDDVTKAIGSLRTLLLGGEPVPSPLVKEAFNLGVSEIYNMYGPTETTIWSAALKLDPADEEVRVGGAIVNTQMYILNTELTPVPFGVTGELYIAGAGLARGYRDGPERTAEKFIPDPFARTPGQRLYRTGDLGKLKQDGNIQLLGRTDQQVKLRGYRIELGDIEATLNALPGIRAAVAVKNAGADGIDRLIAFIVPSQEPVPDMALVRDSLRQRLPHYMVPGEFYVLNDLPLTANGKIDRKALRIPEVRHNREAADAAVSWTDLEQNIATIWKTVLHIENISIDDNFFDIGGHSLLMVQAHQKVQQLLQRDFPLLIMLEHPTIRSIARYLTGQTTLVLESSQDRAQKERNAFLARRDRNLAARNLMGAAS
jgi:natural product biosynthesis luciferase-like monooxygenase protein